MKAEFEEKTFEVAANNEFALLGTGYACPVCGARHCVRCGADHPVPTVDIWAPGQVLEGLLGFDVLVHLDGDHGALDRLLGVAIPPGMHWKKHFGSPVGAGAAPDWASLFIQYKRPERLLRRRGKFLHLFAGPYFRFDLDANQHISLARLRTAAHGQAVVCYASPRFHTNADLLHYRKNRLLLETTAFIEVEDDDEHDFGAYDDDAAFLCSDPVEAVAHSLPGLLATIRRLDLATAETPSGGLRAHLETIASAVSNETDHVADPRESDERQLEDQVSSVLHFATLNDVVWLLAAVAR